MRNSILSLLIFLLIPNSKLFSQRIIPTIAEGDYYGYLYKEIDKYHDTLSKALDSYYSLFVRFKLNENGNIDSILFSIKSPTIILEAITKTFKGISAPIKKRFSKGKWYVQPMIFSFFKETRSQYFEGKFYQCIELPKIDTTNWDTGLNFNHNGLFEVNEKDKNSLGIECVLLKPVSINRTKIFYHEQGYH